MGNKRLRCHDPAISTGSFVALPRYLPGSSLIMGSSPQIWRDAALDHEKNAAGRDSAESRPAACVTRGQWSVRVTVTSAVAVSVIVRRLLRLVGHQHLGGEQNASDRRGILHRGPGHLDRV